MWSWTVGVGGVSESLYLSDSSYGTRLSRDAKVIPLVATFMAPRHACMQKGKVILTMYWLLELHHYHFVL